MCVCVCVCVCVLVAKSSLLFVTPWIVAHQVPLSMGFSRQEYWSGLPFPSPGDLLDPGIKPMSPELQSDSLPSEPQGKGAHVKMFNIFCHYENANQTTTRYHYSPITMANKCSPKCLQESRDRKSHTLLVRILNGTTISENRLAFS